MSQNEIVQDRKADHLMNKVKEFFGIASKATRNAPYEIIYDPHKIEIRQKPEFSPNHYKIELSCWLKNFPNKNSEEAVSRNVHIFLAGEYILNVEKPNNIKIEKYGTKVYYCNTKNQELIEQRSFQQKISTGIHYDGDVLAIRTPKDKEGKIAHPFFHMQFDNSAAREPFTFKSEKHTLNAHAHSSELRNIRVPTSQMDIFSSLIVILYDHLYSTLDNGLFNNIVEQIQNHLWKCFFPDYAQKHEITNSYTMLPSYWYPSETKIDSILKSQ